VLQNYCTVLILSFCPTVINGSEGTYQFVLCGPRKILLC